MTLLEVEGLAVKFETDDGVLHAVDGISFSVDAGQTLGIVGESGSGKSVAALTMMGLTRNRGTQIAGRISFDGRDLLSRSARELRELRGSEIAMIFQDPLSSLHPLYKVGAQLSEAIRVHSNISAPAAHDRAINLLDLVGIPDPHRRVDQYPHELSGGMRQRAMIAMALSGQPKLLIADEPTTALDVTVQAQIISLIASLQRRLGMAVILITHDLGVVAEVADEIAVMYAGRIVEKAPATEIFASPQHPYTWGLLKSIPRLDAPRREELVPIAGRPPSLIHRPSGCHFHPRCPFAFEDQERLDPRLEPVFGAPDHQVACLLPMWTRVEIWEGLREGRDPMSLRGLAEPLEPLAAELERSAESAEQFSTDAAEQFSTDAAEQEDQS